MKHCPRCSSEISKLDKVCPRCGLPVEQMEEYIKKFNLSSETASEENDEQPSIIVSKKEKKRKLKEEKKQQKKAKKEEKEKKFAENEVDFSKMAVNSGEDDPDEILDTDSYSERRKKKKRKSQKPVFLIDENGEFNIDTGDVEIVGEETGKLIEKQYEQSYSVKKSRGDYIPPRLKWWEIYKFADRHFARSKIKKEVNKASKIQPSYVKKSKLLLLAIFLGMFGAHNFYAKNKRKGWVSVITLIIWVTVVTLSYSVDFFASISISIGGFAGFVNFFIWLGDVINIIFNQFHYKFQRDRFIAGLNVQTRAKLGKKYIDMELYHKPWWVRFKVWCEDVKRNSQIRKREKRQANIEKQKRKLQEEQEKAKIEKDIAEFEERENNELDKNKNSFVVDSSIIEEIKTFENENDDVADAEKSESELENKNENENENAVEENKETESENNNSKKKVGTTKSKKYAKTVKNKKAESRKRKK